ncbi:hypothetical protein OsI_25272 [Oryza sativa Indica Group]|uniref:Uncharacterized protein n=1 Tax=Oryza sativa subsp. indica TaxID=39946 RepID=A2YJ66_ORYSI|nr:hypothetical protein OsI_25272 [Oryza sativa Indica Group]
MESSFSVCLEASRCGCSSVTLADGEWRAPQLGGSVCGGHRWEGSMQQRLPTRSGDVVLLNGGHRRVGDRGGENERGGRSLRRRGRVARGPPAPAGESRERTSAANSGEGRRRRVAEGARDGSGLVDSFL